MQSQTAPPTLFAPAEVGINADKLMQILAHELRGPVAPIRFAAALIRSDRLDHASSRALAPA